MTFDQTARHTGLYLMRRRLGGGEREIERIREREDRGKERDRENKGRRGQGEREDRGKER